MVFIEKGQIDVKDGAFVVIDETGIRTHIPVGSVACIMLEPGTRVSHHAAALAARAETLLVFGWVTQGCAYMLRVSQVVQDPIDYCIKPN